MSSITNRNNNKSTYAAVKNTEQEDADNLTEKEIKFLKREARKRKWVRRL